MHPRESIAKLNSFILNEVIFNGTSENEPRRMKIQQRHFFCLMNKISSISNDQISINVKDSFDKFNLIVRPSDGLYQGGTYVFSCKLPNKYPSVPPHIVCETLVYHPNIDDEGAVCISILDDWDQNIHDLTDLVQGVLFLFHHPNLEDPLSPFIACELLSEEFERNVKNSLRGGVVDGIKFARNIQE